MINLTALSLWMKGVDLLLFHHEKSPFWKRGRKLLWLGDHFIILPRCWDLWPTPGIRL